VLSVHQAIVLCLDLSESMNKQSGVSRPMAGHGVLEEDEFDHETASYNLLDESVEDVSEDEILENGESRFSAKNKKKSSDTSAHSYRLLTGTACRVSPSLEVLPPK